MERVQASVSLSVRIRGRDGEKSRTEYTSRQREKHTHRCKRSEYRRHGTTFARRPQRSLLSPSRCTRASPSVVRALKVVSRARQVVEDGSGGDGESRSAGNTVKAYSTKKRPMRNDCYE